jgi:hypothetical protein
MKFLPDKTCRNAPNWTAGPYRICQSWGTSVTHFTATKAGKFIAITRAPCQPGDAISRTPEIVAAWKGAADACRVDAETCDETVQPL